jgi:hypothetical protein
MSLFSKSIAVAGINEIIETFSWSIRLSGDARVFNIDKYVLFPMLSEFRLELGKENEEILIEWRRDPYPNKGQGYIYPLSLVFEKAGLYDKAWRVQMEEGIHEYDGASPIHEYRSYYLRAADTAYRSGNKKLGWSFLMNAAVFENEQSFEMAMQTAELWIEVESGKKALPEPQILTGEARKKAFLEIVERYQKMNAHPRAWLFVQEYKNEFDNADAFIKSIQDDWLDIVNMVTNPQIAGKIIMYGVELYPTKNDPLSIELPWAFPEGSIEKLKKKLQEEAEKIREDEKGGFRFWHNIIEGEKQTKAQYGSCLAGHITLIKQDGNQIVRHFTDLMENDKNYVRRRLDIARYEKSKAGELIYPMRSWQSSNGQYSIEARYISATEEYVRLEKLEGKVITVEFSKLSYADQSYVKRQIELEMQTKKNKQEKP